MFGWFSNIFLFASPYAIGCLKTQLNYIQILDILKDSHIQLQSLFQIFIQGVVRTLPPKVPNMGAHLKMKVLQNNH